MVVGSQDIKFEFYHLSLTFKAKKTLYPVTGKGSGVKQSLRRTVYFYNEVQQKGLSFQGTLKIKVAGDCGCTK